MRLFRGVSEKTCKEYKKKGIPKGSNFTNRLSGAKNRGICIIEVEKKKGKFEPDTKQNFTFKRLQIGDRYFLSKKKIKIFKIR